MKADAAVLGDVLAMFAPLTDEVTLVPTEDGGISITAKSLDTVTVLAVEVLPAAVEDPCRTFSCKLSDLRKALKGQTAEVELEDNRVLIRTGRVTSRISRYADAEPPRVPDLDMHGEAVVPADAVRSLMAGRDEDEATVRIAEDGLHIGLGDDLGNGVSLDIPAEELTLIAGTAKASYPMSHLGAFFKSVPKGLAVDLALRDDFPMRVSMTAPAWRARYFIAPRIQTEE